MLRFLESTGRLWCESRERRVGRLSVWLGDGGEDELAALHVHPTVESPVWVHLGSFSPVQES